MRAFVFPGQGSQRSAWGWNWRSQSRGAQVFQEVDEALGPKPVGGSWPRGLRRPNLTENAQPAIMANAIATLRCARGRGPFALAKKADFASPGTAWVNIPRCAPQNLSLADTARLLRLRGHGDTGRRAGGRGAMCALWGGHRQARRWRLLRRKAGSAWLPTTATRARWCCPATGRRSGRALVKGSRDQARRAAAGFGGKVLDP